MAIIKKHINLRKVAIALLGVYCLIRGIAYLPFTTSGENLPTGLDLMSQIIPITVWAGVWMTAGVVCLIQSFRKYDGIAIPLATGLMLGWGFFYGAGWIADLIVGDYGRGWLTASSYMIPAIVIGIFSAQGGERINVGDID